MIRSLLILVTLFLALTALFPSENEAEADPPTPSKQDTIEINARKPSEIQFLPNATGIARVQGIIGLFVMLGLGYLTSTDRRNVQWRTVGWGMGLTILFACIVLNPLVGQFFFTSVDTGVRRLLGFAEAGIDFVFQSVQPHQVTYIDDHGATSTQFFIGKISPALKSFAVWILPTVIFFSSLTTFLYHIGLMQIVVRVMSRAMSKMMKTSGAETLSCAANIFLGQTEAPLLVRPFIANMTNSELMAVMVAGFGTVAGGVLAIYVGMLESVPGIAGHLVTASIMCAPCSLAVSKLMFPENGRPETMGNVHINLERTDANVIEAVARGASEGMTLVLNIAAMLIAFIGMIAMINAGLGIVGLSMEQILGWIFSPLAWTMGVPWDQSPLIGRLLGEKLVLTELMAYLDMKSMLEGGQAVFSERTSVIASYSLCGFANLASIGIQIGGIGCMAPERRGDISRLGMRAMFAGALVTCLAGTIAGLLT